MSDGFHSARIAAIAHELGLEGYTSPSTDSPIHGAGTVSYLGRETLAVAAGRILGYRRIAGISTSASSATTRSASPPVAGTG